MSPKASSTGVFTGGWFTAEDGSVWPDPSVVLEGEQYGPNGNDYTGTLGTASPITQSKFGAAWIAAAQPGLMDWFATTADYTPKATGTAKTIAGRWTDNPEEVKQFDGSDIDTVAMAKWSIYDNSVTGVAAPSVGDTVERNSETWVVTSWQRGPGEWRLNLTTRERYLEGGGYRFG